MATLKDTLEFFIVFLFFVDKSSLLFLTLSWILQLFDIGSAYNLLFSISLIIWNILIVISLSAKDKYLFSNGYYKFYGVTKGKARLSKAIILGSLLLIHIICFLIGFK